MRDELVGDGLIYGMVSAVMIILTVTAIDLPSGVAHSDGTVFWQQDREFRGQDAHAEVDQL